MTLLCIPIKLNNTYDFFFSFFLFFLFLLLPFKLFFVKDKLVSSQCVLDVFASIEKSARTRRLFGTLDHLFGSAQIDSGALVLGIILFDQFVKWWPSRSRRQRNHVAIGSFATLMTIIIFFVVGFVCLYKVIIIRFANKGFGRVVRLVQQ